MYPVSNYEAKSSYIYSKYIRTIFHIDKGFAECMQIPHSLPAIFLYSGISYISLICTVVIKLRTIIWFPKFECMITSIITRAINNPLLSDNFRNLLSVEANRELSHIHMNMTYDWFDNNIRRKGTTILQHQPLTLTPDLKSKWKWRHAELLITRKQVISF